MRHKFSYSSIIFAPREEVWAFYCDPKNLNQISPKYARVKIERADVPMRVGSEIVIATRWLPKMLWHLKIVEHVANHHFIDQQMSGPFRFWRHTHLFEPSDVGTKLTDKIEFMLPPLIHWLAAPLVHLFLKMYFAHRHRMTRNFIESKGVRRRMPRYQTIAVDRHSMRG